MFKNYMNCNNLYHIESSLDMFYNHMHCNKFFKSALPNLKTFLVNMISQKSFELIVCSLHTQHVEMNAKMLTKRFPFFSPSRKCLITDKFLNSNYHNFRKVLSFNGNLVNKLVGSYKIF